MAPNRRNPPGDRGLRAYAASFLVHDGVTIASSSLLASIRKTLSPDPPHFHHGLLAGRGGILTAQQNERSPGARCERSSMSLEGLERTFQPAFFVRGGHRQTMWANYAPRASSAAALARVAEPTPPQAPRSAMQVAPKTSEPSLTTSSTGRLGLRSASSATRLAATSPSRLLASCIATPQSSCVVSRQSRCRSISTPPAGASMPQPTSCTARTSYGVCLAWSPSAPSECLSGMSKSTWTESTRSRLRRGRCRPTRGLRQRRRLLSAVQRPAVHRGDTCPNAAHPGARRSLHPVRCLSRPTNRVERRGNTASDGSWRSRRLLRLVTA